MVSDLETEHPVGLDLNRLPRHVILIRWGAFRVDLVGRVQVTAAITLVAAIVGLKILVF